MNTIIEKRSKELTRIADDALTLEIVKLICEKHAVDLHEYRMAPIDADDPGAGIIQIYLSQLLPTKAGSLSLIRRSKR